MPVSAGASFGSDLDLRGMCFGELYSHYCTRSRGDTPRQIFLKSANSANHDVWLVE